MGSVMSHNWNAAVSDESVTPSKMWDLSCQSLEMQELHNVAFTFYHRESVRPKSGSCKRQKYGSPAALILQRRDQWGD